MEIMGETSSFPIEKIFPAMSVNKDVTVISDCSSAQAGIKSAGRNINNLRYADDTTLMADSEEELKSLLTKWKWRVKKLA